MPRTTSKASAPPQGLWNEDGLAEYLGISVKTLRDWRLHDRGPRYVKYGKGENTSLKGAQTSVRYRQADVDEWLASHVVEPSKHA